MENLTNRNMQSKTMNKLHQLNFEAIKVIREELSARIIYLHLKENVCNLNKTK